MQDAVSQSDQRLLREYLLGEDRAFNLIYSRYADNLRSAVNKIVHDDHIAEDVVQDAFTKFFERRVQMLEVNNLSGMLFTIALNTARNHVRSVDIVVDQSDRVESKDATPMEVANQKEIVSEIENALALLPKPEREAIRLAFFERKTQKEIGETLSVPEGTVKSKISRALDNLRQIFKNKE